MERKSSLVKDALILCLITLISGLLLGAVNHITKEPIRAAEESAKNDAYKKVLKNAKDFTAVGEDKLAMAEELLKADKNVSDTRIVSALTASLEDGRLAGFVVISTCSKSYGGDISVVTGFDEKGVVTGVEVLSINDTPGLGMKAKDEAFRSQFVSVEADHYTVTKTGGSEAGEIDAISSATITSRAFTNAVNGAKTFVDYLIKGGE